MSELSNQPDQIPAGGSAQSSSYRVSHSTATVAHQPLGPTLNSWDLLYFSGIRDTISIPMFSLSISLSSFHSCTRSLTRSLSPGHSHSNILGYSPGHSLFCNLCLLGFLRLLLLLQQISHFLLFPQLPLLSLHQYRVGPSLRGEGSLERRK